MEQKEHQLAHQARLIQQKQCAARQQRTAYLWRLFDQLWLSLRWVLATTNANPRHSGQATHQLNMHEKEMQ